jgi:hypothetical protein
VKLNYPGPSRFDVPKGEYVARFTGAKPLESKPDAPARVGEDGKPLPPGMAWRFEIIDGPCTGKIPSRITGRVPTPRNACGKMLKALTGLVLKDGMVVDLDQYRDRKYRIVVAVKEHGNGTYVSEDGVTPL